MMDGQGRRNPPDEKAGRRDRGGGHRPRTRSLVPTHDSTAAETASSLWKRRALSNRRKQPAAASSRWKRKHRENGGSQQNRSLIYSIFLPFRNDISTVVPCACTGHTHRKTWRVYLCIFIFYLFIVFCMIQALHYFFLHI